MTIVNTKNNVSGNKGLRLGKRTTVAMGKTKEFITKKKIKHGAQFTKYVSPTIGLFKKAGTVALGAGKLALRFPGTGLIGGAAYLGAKKLGTKYGRGYSHVAMRQFDKKGRKRI